MPFQNYKAKNNVSTTLLAGISSSATTIIVATWAGDLFPSTFPFELTLEQFTWTNVTKREIVKCTARSWDTLTVTRSAGYCPASYTALTQTNTAFSFLSGDTVSLRVTANIIEDINTEVARLETDKLNKSGGTMTWPILQAISSNIASATTTDLSTMTWDSGTITGTTTITSFWTVSAGTLKHLTFSGVLILTYNATSLILPGAQNITTRAGDTMILQSLWSWNWKCVAYQNSTGQPNNTIQTYSPSIGWTATLDCAKGNIHHITMPAWNITIALSNIVSGQCILIRILQDWVWSRTVTWFSTIKWAGGTTPTLTTTASKADSFWFECTWSNTYDGFIIWQNI